jgi:hypothetical protein
MPIDQPGNAMRLTHAFLVIVDISGYTSFITQRTVSLQHAEQIITELMETVIDRADHPLVVNKLEGDAALLYCECAVGDVDAARDVFAQVKAFFPAFYACRTRQREQRSNCNCDACSNIDLLKLKAFVHVGEFAIKQVRQFEELAGEEVILVHRLLKNQVASREYVLLTEAARAAAGIPLDILQSHVESFEGIGELALWLSAPAALPFDLPERRSAADLPPKDGQSSAIAVEREAVFHHLPVIAAEPAPSLMRRLQTWLGRG